MAKKVITTSYSAGRSVEDVEAGERKQGDEKEPAHPSKRSVNN